MQDAVLKNIKGKIRSSLIITGLSDRDYSEIKEKVPNNNEDIVDIVIDITPEEQAGLRSICRHLENGNRPLLISFTYKYYLLLKINEAFEKAGIKSSSDTIQRELNYVRSANAREYFRSFYNTKIPVFNVLDDKVKEKGYREHKNYRVHIFADTIENMEMQKAINSFYAHRYFVSFFTYTKDADIKAYNDSYGMMINNVSYYDASQKKLVKRPLK